MAMWTVQGLQKWEIRWIGMKMMWGKVERDERGDVIGGMVNGDQV
jgi:hypothetical protein